jgi:hypothetical protein
MRLVASLWTCTKMQNSLCIFIAKWFVVQELGEHDVIDSPIFYKTRL